MLSSEEAGNIHRVREHTSELLRSACDSDQPTLIEAPPNSGKTTNAIRLAQYAEKPITYLARRIDLYEQAEEQCENLEGVEWERIPAPHRDCPTFNDDNNGSASAVKNLYAKGWSGREIHLRFPSKAPCGKSCPYYEKLERIDDNIESIDVLIGHHSHCQRHQYVWNRIVIIDEFNYGPFLRKFPDKNSEVIDDPGKILPAFLQAVDEHDDSRLSDVYQDVGDLLQGRRGALNWPVAIDWFRTHGASRRRAQEFSFLNPTTQEYDKVHAYAPFLTFSLLCMEKVGPEIEVAPPPNGHLDETWKEADLSPTTKCLRNRNTGEMYVLDPPNLTSAAQIIGLDGTPTIELWNLLFAPESEFDHQQVISRDDFTRFRSSAMNMSVKQIGGGMHYYAGGRRMSQRDETRFATIQALEDDRFSLITTRKVLQRYKNEGWLERFVRRSEDSTDQDDSKLFEEFKARHYSIIKSSNEFEAEELGVVTGNPFPSDDLPRIWGGFCGKSVEIGEDEEGNKAFGEFGDKIFHHFAHNEVVQAVLRFGRDESVWDSEGSTVYISSHALPDWFEVDSTITLQRKKAIHQVIAKLFAISRSEERPVEAFRTVPTLYEELKNGDDSDDNDKREDSNDNDDDNDDTDDGDDNNDDDDDDDEPDITQRGVRRALENLSAKNHIEVRENAGKHAADIYRWVGDGQLHQINSNEYLLLIEESVYILKKDWLPEQVRNISQL